ncbi:MULTISPECIES: nuclease-related domain-containing DEAD/DEAH box helicase [unclassified Streptomyces]|uniref:nuclease-related domain-containing DEAD/DEAH box helicase n=1 Tax=unclassified Streptomyces TaxID=2593676 RepID=UPI00225A74C2|nr:NERD domain-containing protein [Streptomyces sp. NBC_00452]MCX5056991.1 NERD domain-containing protein [Streptomyces sp. NBC_00452]
MARMIPSAFDPEATPSPGEREVFQRLRDDPGTEGWVVLHSLGIANHPRQIQGEADFVIIVPGKGLLVLEVKAHQQVRRLPSGEWRLGGNRPTLRSPFQQADEAMHAVKEKLIGHGGGLGAVPMTSAVLFTHSRFAVSGPMEWRTWQAIDTVALHSRPISTLIAGVLDAHRAHLTSTPTAGWFNPASVAPDSGQTDRILEALRPSFEFAEPPKLRRQRMERETQAFTAQQYEVLDMIAANRRCLVRGAAGTGKTFVAVEAARRFAGSGLRVLLCCFNRQLGSWLKEETAGVDGITAAHFHSYMSGLVPSARPAAIGGDDFFTEELPDLALEALFERDVPPFDVLVIDEAQDLMRESYLNVLDSSLRGGLSSGQWLAFGDFTRQALYDSDGEGMEALHGRMAGDPAVFMLRHNCRSVPDITFYVEATSDLDPGYAGTLRPSNDRTAEHLWWADSDGQQRLLADRLTQLTREGFRPEDIVVLSPLRNEQSAAGNCQDPRWRNRLVTFGPQRPGAVRYGTVHAFKGLDSPAVILTDIASFGTARDQTLFYVGASRARDELTVLMSQNARPGFRKQVFKEKTA